MTENFEKQNSTELEPQFGNLNIPEEGPITENENIGELEPQFGNLHIPEEGPITEIDDQAETAKVEEIKGTLTETLKTEAGAESNEGEEKKQKLEAYNEMIAALKEEVANEEKKTGFFAKMGSASKIASLKKDIISVTNQKNIEEDYGGTNPHSIIRQTKNLGGFNLKKYSAIKDKGGILSATTHTFGGGA